LRKFSFKELILSVVVGTSALFLTLFAIYFFGYYSSPGPLEAKKVVYIQKGSGLSAIAQHLGNEGIIDHPLFFEAHLRLRGVSHHLRAGEFEFRPHESPAQVFETLSTGPFVQHGITVPEGMRTKDVIGLLNASNLLTKEGTVAVKEGEILPETYYYTRDESQAAVLDRMKHAMNAVLEKAWHLNKTGHFLQNPQEVLVLASIVEKETGVAAERPRVAAVFLNRLKRGMLLQSDPTVIYGLEYELNRPVEQLSKADLHMPTSYNTYLHKGLPPTPICNPGKASIEAVMKPMATEDLYFVADGTGGHVFARTYEEHMVNHQKWRRIRASHSE